jgi:hypothetical protein
MHGDLAVDNDPPPQEPAIWWSENASGDVVPCPDQRFLFPTTAAQAGLLVITKNRVVASCSALEEHVVVAHMGI